MRAQIRKLASDPLPNSVELRKLQVFRDEVIYLNENIRSILVAEVAAPIIRDPQ